MVGVGDQADGRFGDHAEGAFAAHQQTGDVEAVLGQQMF